MHTENYRYKAFISYRHLPYDKAVATQLQRILEGYKPPAPLRENGVSHWRLFRDETELPTSSDLGQDIYHALEDSEFLICICSEAYPDSKWCMAELEYFKSLHHGSMQHIIPLLISGEPDTSFPELLRFDAEKQQQVEPLAANITADTEKESMQRLRSTEYLRIAAHMLHCAYDDLYQRHKRRERKQKLLIRAAVGGVLAVIAGISAAYMVSLSHKNAEIVQQNDMLESNQQLIKAQNQDLLSENSRQLAVESSRLYQDGDYISAIQTALEALPSADTPRPIVPEAERTLSEELFAFEENSFVPGKALIHDTVVENIICTNNGQTAVIRDAYSVYVWNTQTGELLQKYPLSDFRRTADSTNSFEKIKFYHAADCPEEDFMVASAGAINYDVKPGLGMVSYQRYKYREAQPAPAPDPVYIYNGYGDIWKLSEQTGEILWSSTTEQNYSAPLLFREQDVLRIVNDFKDYFVEQIDLRTGNVQKKIPVIAENYSLLSFYPKYYDGSVLTGFCYDTSNSDFIVLQEEPDGFHITQSIPPDDESLIYGNTCKIGEHHYTLTWKDFVAYRTVLLRQYDDSFQNELWQTSLNGGSGLTNAHFILFRAEDTENSFDILAAVLDGDISMIHAETGKVLCHYSLDSGISALYYAKKGVLFVLDKSQQEYAINVFSNQEDTLFYMQKVDQLRHFVTGTEFCGYCNDTYVTAGRTSNTAYVYTEAVNPDFRKIDINDILPDRGTKGFYYNSASVSPAADMAAVSYTINKDETEEGHFCLFDCTSGKQIPTPYDIGYTVDRMQFMEGSHLLLALHPTGIYQTQMLLYDAEQQKVIASAEEIASVPFLYTNPDKTYTIFLDFDSRKNIAVHSDGTIDPAPDHEAETRYTMKDSDRLCTFSPTVPAFAAVMKASKPIDPDAPEPEYQLMVCSFAQQYYHTIPLDSAGIGTEDIQSLFYLTDTQLCVLTYDCQILCFDTERGAILWNTTTKGVASAISKCARLTDTDFVLLGTDLCLYRMTKDGFTGTKEQLSYIDSVSEKDQLSCQIVTADHTDQILVTLTSNDSLTSAMWLLDWDTFTVRYHMDNAFLSYCAAEQRLYTYDKYSKQLGSFPVYEAAQLTEKTRSYISGLYS